MNTQTSIRKQKGKSGWGILALAFATLVGTTILQIIGYVISYVCTRTEALPFTTMSQLFTAGSMVLGMLVLGGIAWIRPSREDIRVTFRTYWPIIAADVAIVLFACGEYIIEGASVSPNWLPNLAITLVLCLGIGIAEEFLFRGIILNGILAVSGKSHRGTMIAVAITSLLFGLVHVSLSTDFAEPLLAVQAVLKIVQTALFSICMCSIVLRTHRLGGVSLLHGLTDFLLLVPSLALAGESLTVNYVHSGEDGMMSIVVYLVIIAFYLPFAIKALRQMHRERVAYRGVFFERAAKRRNSGNTPTLTEGMANAA